MLVGAVLLQPGKTDAGALFTSNVNSNSFGPRGTATVLSKITIGAAIIFMISALMISMPAFNGGVSVLNSTPETPAEAPADANANTSANTDLGGAANTADNSNGALIQTPATDQFSNQAANTATNSNTAAADSNSANKAANKNAAAPKATATPKK